MTRTSGNDESALRRWNGAPGALPALLKELEILKFFAVLVLAVALALPAFSAAATLAGSVKNGTSGKPASGDEVVLLNLSQGMQEGGRTKADARGNFSFNVADQGPHLIRAIHQGVTYHRMAPPGTTSVEVEVFDVAKRVENISVTADVMKIGAENGQLNVVRLFAVNNSSSPPRTQMNDQNFEFYLPDGAQVDQSMVKTANGQPLNQAPVPQKEKNRYAFIFPLRPGQTEFQVSFHLPYSGEASIDPKLLYGAEHFVVMLPKSIQFTPPPGGAFQSMQDPQQSEAAVQVASRTQVGQPLAFKISGTGSIPDAQSAGAGGGAATAGGPGPGPDADRRPGGGLGAPIDAPDPLQKYRWYILGGLAVVLGLGAIYVASRQQSARAQTASAPLHDFDIPHDLAPIEPQRRASAASRPAAPRSGTLDALKEELFQLELDHKQGNISSEEYQKARAALDYTLERALKRESQKV